MPCFLYVGKESLGPYSHGWNVCEEAILYRSSLPICSPYPKLVCRPCNDQLTMHQSASQPINRLTMHQSASHPISQLTTHQSASQPINQQTMHQSASQPINQQTMHQSASHQISQSASKLASRSTNQWTNTSAKWNTFQTQLRMYIPGSWSGSPPWTTITSAVSSPSTSLMYRAVYMFITGFTALVSWSFQRRVPSLQLIATNIWNCC